MVASRLQNPTGWDERVTRWVMGQWHRRPTLDATAIVMARWTPIAMVALIALVSTGFAMPPGSRHMALEAGLQAVAAAVLGRTANEFISRVVKRPRPFEFMGVAPLLTHDHGGSFPSNHATGAFALALGMASVPGVFEILLVLAVLLSLSRIYTGLHHTSDVVAGALHGAAAAWIIAVIATLVR